MRKFNKRPNFRLKITLLDFQEVVFRNSEEDLDRDGFLIARCFADSMLGTHSCICPETSGSVKLKRVFRKL